MRKIATVRFVVDSSSLIFTSSQSMKVLLNHFFRKAVDWLFRRRSRPIRIMNLGIICIFSSIGTGWILDVSFPFQGGQVNFSFNSPGGVPAVVTYILLGFGLLLIGVGLVLLIIDYGVEQRRIDRKKVIIVEARGLRDGSGTPLIDAIPPMMEGHRDQILVDLRQRVRDGEIESPEAVLTDLSSLPADIRRRENGFDRRDITLIYGGLTPVPFTFLTGVLVDDERKVLIFDWDRHEETWRELGEEDDGKRFQNPVLTKTLPNGSNEVALTVSVSYRVIVEDVQKRVGEIPVVELILDGGSPDCHWSEDKQRALGQQFLNTAIKLSNRGIECIHLFLAAQNSVVFRLGRLYDKRNLPKVVVYQYQRNATVPYSWGVLMPVCGVDHPAIVSGK